MEAKFNRSALQETLTLVSSIVPSRTPKPIMQCLKISAADGAVKICATDGEVGIESVVVQVEIVREGVVVVPADKLVSIVRESTDEVIEMSASESMVQITGADSRFMIYSHEPSENPAVPGFDG